MEKPQSIFENKNFAKELLYKFVDYKWWFIVTIALFLVVAFMINQYSTVIYQNSTTLLVLDDKNNTALLPSEVSGSFGFGMGDKNIENEINLLQSFSMVNEVITNMNLEVSYVKEKYLFNNNIGKKLPLKKEYDLYTESPINVILDKSHKQPIDMPFNIVFISGDKFKISAAGEDVSLYNYIDNLVVGNVNIDFSGVYEFGETISTDNFSFKVEKSSDVSGPWSKESSLFFYFNHLDYLTLGYMGALTVEPVSENASILRITAKGNNPDKITIFLNELINVYLTRKLDKKNEVAKSTIKFIEGQISDISDSLANAQSNLQAYRTNNQIMDLGYQGQQIFDKMSELETEKATLQDQRKYYQYLKEYFTKNTKISDLVAPASQNIVDPVLNGLISQLIQVTSEKNRVVSNETTNSPYIAQYEKEINNLKKSILENVENNLNTITLSMNEIDYRIRKMSGEISRMPRTELTLKDFERKFKLNDEIYTFLLQRRAEAQIARASNSPDFEIVDLAKKIRAKVTAPKKKLNYLIAIFFGLVLPTSGILILDFLNDKIRDKRDIEHLTKLPVIGYIFHNYKNTNTVLIDFPKSSISESFRATRTNIQINTKGNLKKTFVVTSSASGEGKSFIAMNLASSFAVFGRKTLLMGFDLRKPSLFQDFGLKNIIGITSYLSNRALLSDIIQPTHLPNLDIITAGPIPPNPMEMIASDKTAELINKLKENYDYIVIDTAPVGIVSDSYFLLNSGDINIFVMRQNYTNKQSLATTLENLKSNKIENLNLILNDLAPKKSYGYGGYNYGRNKYYSDDRPDSIISRVFSFRKTAQKSKERKSA